MSAGSTGAAWMLLTPPGAGAVAIVQLHGDVDRALRACGIAGVQVGRIGLRDLMGVDRGLVARVRPDVCQLMPHGGVAVVRELCRLLVEHGIEEDPRPDPGLLYPESRSEVEALALAALARAASPLVVDLLLAQHALWAEPGATSDPARDRVLRRLIDPPLVVAFGASNIGKSTLVNALAGRGVSIVADEPGTTRDHVGVMLDLGGVVVRLVDTPGVRAGAGAIEREALATAAALARGADLLLWCGDAGSGLVELPAELAGVPRLTVALREDLGRAPFHADARVSAAKGEGLGELTEAVRKRLVPREIVERRQAWRFWE